jgi:hypothetical protein
VGAALDSSGKVSTTIGNTQVLVGGFPAPMIFASSTQVSAVVPYEIAGFANPNVQVKYLGQTSNGVLVNVASTHPGLFTLNASGTGPGAILNQNASTNGPSNPAARGETVVVFLTGEGQTNPPGIDGKRAIEKLALEFGSKSKLGMIIGRPFAFLGPYLPLGGAFAASEFFAAALAGQSVHVTGDGAAARSYLYAADLAAWLWKDVLRAQSISTRESGLLRSRRRERGSMAARWTRSRATSISGVRSRKT